MKQGRNPTLKQMLIMRNNKMDFNDWLVTKVMPDRIECVSRWNSKTTKPAFLHPMVLK